VKAIWNGKTIADSNDTIVVEGNHYFPVESINKEFLREHNTTTHCDWKGKASYYDIVIGYEINECAAWCYATPLKAAKNIRGRLAFWKGVEVVA